MYITLSLEVNFLFISPFSSSRQALTCSDELLKLLECSQILNLLLFHDSLSQRKSCSLAPGRVDREVQLRAAALPCKQHPPPPVSVRLLVPFCPPFPLSRRIRAVLQFKQHPILTSLSCLALDLSASQGQEHLLPRTTGWSCQPGISECLLLSTHMQHPAFTFTFFCGCRVNVQEGAARQGWDGVEMLEEKEQNRICDEHVRQKL